MLKEALGGHRRGNKNKKTTHLAPKTTAPGIDEAFITLLSHFGGGRGPSGRQKTMKIIVLSSKIKVSLISKKHMLSGSLLVPLGLTLGTILDAFALFGAPFGAPWAPKAVQKSKKNEKIAGK